MPELPDVEISKRYVDATSLHKPIAHVRIADRRLLEGVTRQKLAGALTDASLESTRRHGKLLGVHTREGGWLILHFGMTGALDAEDKPGDPPEHAAMMLEFRDGSRLTYINRRRLGKITLSTDFDEYLEREHIGPDALDFDAAAFGELVRGARGKIKPLLMNQNRIAGLGNVYADEVLFHARIDPARNASDLDDDEIGAIHGRIGEVVETAVERGAEPSEMPGSWLLPRREPGASCPRCAGRIEKSTISGRATYFCPSCQS